MRCFRSRLFSAWATFLTVPLCVNGQAYPFEKVVRAELFSIDGMALVPQVKQSSGRSLIVSNAVIDPANGADILVQVFGLRGDVLHDLVIGGLDYHDVCKEVAQLDDAYYLAGYTRGIDTSAAHTFTAFLIKLDTALNLVWQRNYILPGQELYAEALTITEDDDLLIAGRIYDGSEFHTCVMKTDTTGQLLWMKQYAMPFSEGFTCIRELLSGDILLSGSVTFGFELSVPTVLKLDADGELHWGKYYNYPPISKVERSTFQFIRPLNNTEVLLAGHTDVMGAGGQDLYMVRIDTSGALVHAHTYGGSQFEEPFGMNFDGAQNELVMEGNSGSFDPDFETRAFSVRIHPNGLVIGAMLYGDTALHQPVQLYHFTRVDNENVQLAGARPYPANDIYLTGTDNDGVSCHAYPADLTVQAVTTTTGNYLVDITDVAPELNDLELPIYHFENDTFLCEPPPDHTFINEREGSALRIYPNPGNGRFMAVPLIGWTPRTVGLRDALGRMVLEQRWMGAAVELPEGLAPGPYMVTLSGNAGERTTVRYVLH